MALHRRFQAKDFSLRDYLALERTILSNERTLLAYWGTGLALVAAGITGFEYFEGALGQVLGIFVTEVGLLVTLFDIVRFRSIKGRLDSASPDETADATATHVSASGSSPASSSSSSSSS